MQGLFVLKANRPKRDERVIGAWDDAVKTLHHHHHYHHL